MEYERTLKKNDPKEKGLDLQSLRNSNLRVLLSAIWNYSPISRYELAHLTGLAPSSVTRLIQELAQLGLIKDTGKGESSGGRQPTLIVPNPDAGLVICLDLSSANLRGAILDAANSLISVYEQPFSGKGPQAIQQQVMDVISRLLEQPAARERRLLGIGVSQPGTVDLETGDIRDSYNLRLHNFPLRRILMEKFSLPVYIEHDASVAALAEQYYGAGRGAGSLVYILVSTGIGSGIILDGAIYRGQAGNSGEFGHIILNREGQMCVCGRRGCLEAEAAGPAIVANAQRILSRDAVLEELVGGDPAAVTVDIVAEAARLGDPLAIEILASAADTLAHGISIYATLFDIRLFIVGGEVAETGELFLGQLEQAIKKYRREGIEIEIVPAQLKKNTFLRGISMLTLQEVLNAHL